MSSSSACTFLIFFFFKQKTAYEIRLSLVGSEMCKGDREKVWDMYREHFEATTPMPYVGMPEDAAWAVVYLCSDEAKYINGVCLPVDGGWAVQK